MKTTQTTHHLFDFAPYIATIDPNPYEHPAPDAFRFHRAHLDHLEDVLIGFHTSTKEDQEQILAGNIEERTYEVGGLPFPDAIIIDENGGVTEGTIPTRTAPAGFWVNGVPWIPYSIDQFHPTYDNQTDMAVTVFLLPGMFGATPHVEHTWPHLQWPVPLEMAKTAARFRLHPQNFLDFRGEESRHALRGYIKDALREGLMPSDGYVAAILKNA